MLLRALLCMVLGCSLAACSSPAKKQQAAAAKLKEPTMDDASGDTSFQAFLGRLRKAVADHDVDTVATMMTTNFGYRLNPIGEGEGVFQYWDDELLWPQLQAIIGQHWAPQGNFMVAPPEFLADPNYHGYRAGITSVDGTWKFAYFVNN